MKITDRQRILDFIVRTAWTSEGRIPTVREVATELGYKESKIRWHWHALHLEGILGPPLEDRLGPVLPIHGLQFHCVDGITVAGNCSQNEAMEIATLYRARA